MEDLTLEIACKIADAAIAAAKAKDMNITVAVIDRSGNMITMQRMEHLMLLHQLFQMRLQILLQNHHKK